MDLYTLEDWLRWIDHCHTHAIDLSLERVRMVADRLSLLSPACPVITVGGTNGKGSTVATLGEAYLASGYRVGVFTSPVIFKHNEYVRVNGQTASDEAFCDAYRQIEATRGEVTLTPFEFHTLAALIIFKSSHLDVMLLEVGLGGRLDAVNLLDAEVSIVTSISLDHQAYLGNTVSDIAREKAGIFRKNKPAICGDLEPPSALLEAVSRIGATPYQSQRDFKYILRENEWSWAYQDTQFTSLALPRLNIQNVSCALMAITLMQNKLPVSAVIIENVLPSVSLTGRLEIYAEAPMKIRDVAHNPGSVERLTAFLKQTPKRGKTFAVFSMLADKDIASCLAIIEDEIDDWYVAPLQNQRAASILQLQDNFTQIEPEKIHWYENIKTAYQQACANASPIDRIVTFGSFHVLGELNGE